MNLNIMKIFTFLTCSIQYLPNGKKRELNVFHAYAARELAEEEEEELRNEMLWNAESTAHDLRSTYLSSLAMGSDS